MTQILKILILIGILLAAEIKADDALKTPTILRMIRAYGDNEREPPILILSSGGNYEANVGSQSITVEMDISANVPPNLYARFVHCTADWNETPNQFYQDIAQRRFSNISWQSSTFSNSYYSYRGKFTFPDINIKLKYSGNWKVLFYDYQNDTTLFASAKFFIAETRAGAEISIWNAMYEPAFHVSSTCYNLEARVWSNLNILDNNVHSCVLYRNNRYDEPIVITDNPDINQYKNLYRYTFNKMISGFITSRKSFRIEGIPAENEYRVLDLTNMGYFPRVDYPMRLPLADLRRNGTFFQYDDEGVMLTDRISSTADDYVNVEFIMEPEWAISKDDVFIIGSMNGWQPTADWQMYYDEVDRYYKLSHWVRRGKHDYLYASGTLDYDQNKFVNFSTDEYEGNTSLNDHYFLAFFYYHDIASGGFDAIIAVSKQSISNKY